MKNLISVPAILTIILLFGDVILGQDEFQQPAPFLTLDISKAEVPLEFGLAITDAEAEFLIEVDRLALASDPTALSLDLYKDTRLEARRFKTRRFKNWMSWSGELHFPDALSSDRPGGVAIFVDHGDHVSGIIQVDATHDDFQIVGTASGKHHLIRLKRNRVTSCGVDTKVAGAESGAKTPLGNTAMVVSNSIGVSTTEAAQIDVLAMVPNGQMSSQTEDFIIDSFAAANNVFDYSNVNAFYNLVYIEEIAPDVWLPSNNLFDLLKWMNAGGANFIEERRASAGADMVAMFVNLESGPCGVANLRYRVNDHDQVLVQGLSGILWDDNEPAYSVHKIGCSLTDYTFAHELGHNFGLRHDYNDSGGDPNEFIFYPPIDPNPRGYEFMTWMGERATVMGCYGPDAPCERTHYYSDPQIYWYGWCPTGDESEPYRANAASALRNRVLEYSLLR